MSAQPPAPSGPEPDDPIGVRYPNTARIWNYQLGGKDNFAVDRQASDAANAMVRGLGVPGRCRHGRGKPPSAAADGRLHARTGRPPVP